MRDVKKGKERFGSVTTNVILVFVIIVAINVIAAGLYFRLDITEENLYTLSKGTEKIVEAIKTPITIKYYFTRELSSLPLSYKNYGQKIGELLEEYKNLNPEMISLENYDPKPDSDEEEWAKKFGLSAIELGNGERLFMGIVVLREDNEINLPFLDPRRERFLEYDITQLLLRTYQERDKIIGVMSVLPVMGTTANRFQQMQGQRSRPKWAFITELEKTFKIQSVDPSVNDIDDAISILLVIHPKKLSDSTLYAIDQFVLRGGELIVLVDPNARIDESAAMMARMGQMGQASSDLNKLFKHWGIEYNSGSILGDKEHATRVNAGARVGVVSFCLWHSLNRDSFNPDLIATKELDNMLMIEPGGFLLTPESPLKLNSLIHSSANSGLVASYMTRFSDPSSINKSLKTDGKRYTLAGILTGSLTSAFDKRPDEKKKDGKEKGTPEKLNPHIAKSVTSSKIMLITDVDFIHDQFSVDKFSMMGQTFLQPKNDNLNFIVNMTEFLGGAEAMMEIRSRGRFSRPFTRFEELRKHAQIQYQEAESALSAKLLDVQQKLSRLKVEKGTNKVVLTKEQIDKIKQFRAEEKKQKTELRKIRKLLRQDIEFEKSVLTGLNLLFIPILLTIFGLFFHYRRFRPKS